MELNIINTDPEFFWKNFRLGTELQISGSFLYNALYFLDQMDSFHHDEDCFEFLYNSSVGLERMEKIVLILLEHNKSIEQEKFEKSLITHNHLVLINRIMKLTKILINKNQNKFLQLSSEFYNSGRYGKYNLISVFQKNMEKKLLIDFVNECLNLSINADGFVEIDQFLKIKKFIGKTVISITKILYEIIYNKASELNLFTYEIRYNSKAYKIFIEKEFSFDNEKTLQKEIILFLIKNEFNLDLLNFIKSIESYKFEHHNINYYIKFLLNFHKHRDLLDELEFVYSEKKFDKDRFVALQVIGSDFSFDNNEDEIF